MTGSALVERYLAEIADLLPNSERARGEVLDELRDGIAAAVAEREPETRGDVRKASWAAVRSVLAEFGAPAVLGSALGAEIRLRRARRAAWLVAVTLALMGVCWQAYAVVVGTPESMIPGGSAGVAFLAGVDIATTAPVVAQVGALSMVAATSLRGLGRAAVPVLRLSAAVTAVAVASLAVAVLLIAATAESAYRVEVLAVSAVFTCGFAVVAAGAVRALRHAHASRTLPAPH